MKWKLDEEGHVVLKDGNPVLADDNGTELVVNSNTVVELRNEAKGHRVEKEKALERLKPYEGLDPEVARKAVETVGKLDAKQLIDSGKVDEVKRQITEQFQSQINGKEAKLKETEARLNNVLIDNVFNGSEFVRNSVAIPVDIFRDSFSKFLKVEEGQVVAVGKDGNRLFSKKNAGEYATPEEALQILVETHPQKDTLLKADTGAGSGSKGGGSARGGSRSMSRADFEKLQPHAQSEIAKKIQLGDMQLTD